MHVVAGLVNHELATVLDIVRSLWYLWLLVQQYLGPKCVGRAGASSACTVHGGELFFGLAVVFHHL
jgi:hypothetical protein